MHVKYNIGKKMDITFGSIYNAGATTYRHRTLSKAVDRIVFQLDGDDFEEFKNVFKIYPDRTNNGNIKFDVIDSFKKGDKPRRFFLNSSELKVNEENFHIFEKLSKIFNRISNGKEKIILEKEYYEYSNSIDHLTEGLLPDVINDWVQTKIDAKDFKKFKTDKRFKDATIRKLIPVEHEYEKHHVQVFASDINKKMLESVFSRVA